eukprot:scaffold117857_cov33-Tisochrysis_lutea.AAC.1
MRCVAVAGRRAVTRSGPWIWPVVHAGVPTQERRIETASRGRKEASPTWVGVARRAGPNAQEGAITRLGSRKRSTSRPGGGRLREGRGSAVCKNRLKIRRVGQPGPQWRGESRRVPSCARRDSRLSA